MKLAPMDMIIAVGFGDARVTKDDVTVFDGEQLPREIRRLSEFEAMAVKDPGDWKAIIHAPLYGATYRRVSPNMWVLIEENEGFA